MKKPSSRKKRAPFMDRFNGRIVKLKEWVDKVQPKFASAPQPEVGDSLSAIVDSLEAIIEAVPKLKSWAPATGSSKFAVGDAVSFKKEKLDELVTAGLYKKSDLEGKHEIEAVAGRKVKLACGLFQSLYVSKAA